MRRHSLLPFIGCCAFSMFFATASQAQTAEGFAADRFAPSERGSRFFALDSLDLRGSARPAFGTVATWARNPLVIRSGSGDVRTSIVEQQLVMHAGGSIVLADRFRVGANLPIGAYQSGQHGTAAGATFAAPQSTAIGDARLSGDVKIIGSYGDVFTSSLGIELGLPTGDRDAYMSDHVFSATPRALAAGRLGAFVYAGRFGVQLRPESPASAGDRASNMVFGAAAGVELADERVHLGAELFGSTAIAGNAALGARTTPIEVLFGARARVVEDVVFGLGVGPGLTRSDGSPEVRGLASLEWAPRARSAAPQVPVRLEPEPQPEPEPAPAPVAAAVVATADRDGDGVEDIADACPDSPGPIDTDPTKSGCAEAELVDGVIHIREQVKFRLGSSELDPVGDATLNAVANVLANHREIERIRVEGHTDSAGIADHNAALSAARARAVVTWLASHGVESTRLEARGYGADRPLTTNSTEEGRRINRRVEFHVATGESQ